VWSPCFTVRDAPLSASTSHWVQDADERLLRSSPRAVAKDGLGATLEEIADTVLDPAEVQTRLLEWAQDEP